MPRDDEESDSVISSTPLSAQKRSRRHKIKVKKVNKNGTDGLMNDGILAIVSLLKANTNEDKKLPAVTHAELSLQGLNSLYDKHVSHMAFLKENDLLTPEKKVSIVRNIEEVYEKITNWHGVKKRSRDDDSDREEIINNYNSKVS